MTEGSNFWESGRVSLKVINDYLPEGTEISSGVPSPNMNWVIKDVRRKSVA